jgi:hypothetical protein
MRIKCAAVLRVAAISLPLTVAAQQASFSGKSATGSLSLVRTVNLRQQSQQALRTALAATVETVRPVPPRLVPPGVGFPSSAGGAQKPTPKLVHTLSPSLTQSGAALTVSTGAAVSGFNALSHLEQRSANSGNQFSIEPPNPSIAVANGIVLEGVNDAVRVYSQAGAAVLSPLASNQVFGLAPAINRGTGVNGVYLTDMRVYYDEGLNRWFIVQRAQDNDSQGNSLSSSHLYVAVSQTADPAAVYNIYEMDTTNATNSGCPCIADYPQIGSDQYGFYIAWNEFNYSPGSGFFRYVDAAVLAISKSSLLAGSTSPTAVQFLLPYTSGFEFSLQPASAPPGASNFLASGGVEFFVSTVLGSSSEIAVWAMSNTISLSTANPALGLARTTFSTLPYFVPNGANQKAGSTPLGSSLIPPGALQQLDGGDVRVQAVSYASGRLYVTFGTGVLDESGQQVIGGIYVVLSPTFRAGVLAGKILSQGYLYVNGNDLLRPAIAVNAQGNGAVAVTLTGRQYYPTAAVIPFRTGVAPTFVEIAAAGALPEDGFSGYSIGGGFGVARWGDYNTAVAVADGSIWSVVEYIGPYERSEFANWNTYVFRRQP